MSVPDSSVKAYISPNSFKGDIYGSINVFCDGGKKRTFCLGTGHGLTEGCDVAVIQTTLEAALRTTHDNSDGASKGQRRTWHQYQSDILMYVHSLVY